MDPSILASLFQTAKNDKDQRSAEGVGGATDLYTAYVNQQQAKRANAMSQDEIEAYKEALAQQAARVGSLQLPNLTIPQLSAYSDAGSFSPEDVQAQNLAQSELAGFSSDPALRGLQMSALSQLGQWSSGQLTDTDKYNMQQAQLDASRAEQGRQQAILADAARRGVGGSGLELASRLQSSQSAADRATQAQQDALRAAQARALSAIAQQGSLAGSVRGQDLGEAQARAAAMDRIAQANWQNSQGISSANTAARNAAAQANLANRQKLANANIDIFNQQAMLPNQTAQQNFMNAAAKEKLYAPVTSDPYKMEVGRIQGKQQQDAATNQQYGGAFKQLAGSFL